MTREWRPIEGLSDYEISNDGLVRSWKRVDDLNPSPRVLKQSINRWGHHRITLSPSTDNKVILNVARAVAKAFLGPVEGKHVHHKNENKSDNRVENLEILEEGAHQSKHPRKKAEEHYRSTLTWEDVERIRSLRGEVSQRKLAEEYGMTQSGISRIQLYRTWREDG